MRKLTDKIKEMLGNDRAMKEVLRYIISFIIILSLSLLVYNLIAEPKENGTVRMDKDSEVPDGEETAGRTDEQRFCEMLSEMKGLEDVKVMVRCSETQRQESCVEGVMIVARGTENVVTKNNIMRAAEAVFGLPANRISVLERK